MPKDRVKPELPRRGKKNGMVMCLNASSIPTDWVFFNGANLEAKTASDASYSCFCFRFNGCQRLPKAAKGCQRLPKAEWKVAGLIQKPRTDCQLFIGSEIENCFLEMKNDRLQ